MDAVRHFLEAQPLFTLFLTIALGYAIGQLSIRGFSLGAGAVLFSGLAIGALAPAAAPPAMVGTLGLLMFLYGIGIQYGRAFFDGLRGPGLVWNLLSLVAVLASLLVALALGRVMGLSTPTAVGLFAGSGTSTSALQAALSASGSADPAIGYSVSYPFGVVGPILAIYFFTLLVRPRLQAPRPAMRSGEVTIDRPELVGRTVAQALAAFDPHDLQVLALRRDHHSMAVDGNAVLQAGDGLLLMGRPPVLEAAIAQLGHAEVRVFKDRSEYDVIRVYVSKPVLLGSTLAELPQPDFMIRIAQVRRGDLEMLPSPDLVLESGDRLTVLHPAGKQEEVRAFFGDSVRASAEFSYVSVGLGMVLGLALGAISVPVPGLGSFSLGVAGGPLIMALILGRLGRSGPICWRMPAPANLVLRNLGLTLFLAAVALQAGPPFVHTVSATGLPILLAGMAVLLTNVLVVLLVGYFVLRIPFDAVVGVMSGATGNPAIPAYGTRQLQSERVDLGYATIFPSMTIAKVILAQLAIGLLATAPA
ncbi:MAG: YidE/YbjL duplication [Burkholderiaceae bacterium]|jgi:putative transport protein|nr:YidE/YbjL duplication [Burkholderiaceae bacterium]